MCRQTHTNLNSATFWCEDRLDHLSEKFHVHEQKN